MREIYCALKHAYIVNMSFIEIKQKLSSYKDNEIQKIYNETNKLHEAFLIIVKILEEIYFFNKKIEKLNEIEHNVRVIRSKLINLAKQFINLVNNKENENKELIENAFLDDFRTLISNLAHLEIHLNLSNLGENNESNRNK